MEKISKQSIVDLAKKLPVVNELDQSQMVGGSVYVSPYGVRYGKAGYNDTFYVLGSDAVYKQILNKNVDERDNQGIALYEATPERFSGTMSAYEGIEIQKNVFAAYAKHEISYEGAVAVINDHSVSEDIFFQRGGGIGSGVLNFNVARSGMIFTEEGLRQELFRVRKTIDYSDSGSIPGGSGSIPNEESIQNSINEISRSLYILDNYEDKDKKLIGLRSDFAQRLYSLWQQLPVDRKERMYSYEMAKFECGLVKDKPLT